MSIAPPYGTDLSGMLMMKYDTTLGFGYNEGHDATHGGKLIYRNIVEPIPYKEKSVTLAFTAKHLLLR